MTHHLARRARRHRPAGWCVAVIVALAACGGDEAATTPTSTGVPDGADASGEPPVDGVETTPTGAPPDGAGDPSGSGEAPPEPVAVDPAQVDAAVTAARALLPGLPPSVGADVAAATQAVGQACAIVAAVGEGAPDEAAAAGAQAIADALHAAAAGSEAAPRAAFLFLVVDRGLFNGACGPAGLPSLVRSALVPQTNEAVAAFTDG